MTIDQAIPQQEPKRRRRRLPQVGEMFAGRLVVGILNDGVRILEPAVPPETFTSEEWRDAVHAVIRDRQRSA